MNMSDCQDRHQRMGFGPFQIVGMVVGGLVLAVVLGFLFGYFVMLLWNWLMPALFGLKVITYWQAFGLIVLSKILFGGHGFQRHGHGHNKWHDKHWRKFAHMSGDEIAPGGDFSNWKYYQEYWKTEGKTAFESYLDRIKAEEKNK
jgi:hypothetical protein